MADPTTVYNVPATNVRSFRNMLSIVQARMDDEHVRVNSRITVEQDVVGHGYLTAIRTWESGRADIFNSQEAVLPMSRVDIIRVLLKEDQYRPERIVELSIRLYSIKSEYYNEDSDEFQESAYFLVVFELNSRYKTNPDHVVHRVQKMYFDDSLNLANAFSGPDDVEFRAMMRNGPMKDFLDLSRSGSFDRDIHTILSEPRILGQVFLAFSKDLERVGHAHYQYLMERKM
jgi:hypothetical protein